MSNKEKVAKVLGTGKSQILIENCVTYAHKDNPNGARFRSFNNLVPKWAVDVRDELPRLPNVREPYYDAQDSLIELRDALEITKDSDLLALVESATEALDELRNRLSKKYIWD